jgi:hypothetical protein
MLQTFIIVIFMKHLKLQSLYVGLLTFVVFAANSCLYAQSIRINDVIDFDDERITKGLTIDFNNLEESNDFLYQKTFHITNELEIESISVINIETLPANADVSSAILINSVPESLIPEVYVSLFRKKPYAVVSFVPFIRGKDGTLLRIVSYEIDVSGQQVVKSYQKGNKFNSTSVFSQGDWYKIRINSDKVYKLSYGFLKEMGVNVGSLNPNQLNVYGHPGGMLPIDNSVDAPGDPQKLAIEFVGNQDNSFSDGEYFLFYGEGPDSWNYSENLEMWTHLKNYYSDYSYFFIRVDDNNPKRVIILDVFPDPPDIAITEYDDFNFHEINTENLIKSGRIFFGEKYENKLEYEFNFSYPNLVPNSEIKIRTAVAARNHGGTSSSFTVTSTGGEPHSFNVEAVSGDYNYAKYKVDDFSYVPASTFSTLNVKIKYNQQFPVNLGWLDYLETNVRSKLNYRNGQLSFRDQQDIGTGLTAEYRIENAANSLKVWDVSNYNSVQAIPGSLESGTMIFKRPHESAEKYVAFRNEDAGSPEAVGSFSNQNIHEVSQVDMVIIAHPDFISAAQNIAAFHDEEGLSTFITTENLIFNEFSSGKKDPTAIKHFMKSLYDDATSPDDIRLRYLLLLGDASYDQGPGSEHSYVLTYQSVNSWNLLNSYVTDDYFGLLDDNDSDRPQDMMDIGVGRFPVTNLQQANDIIAKMKVYKEKHTISDNESVADFNQSPYGNWRNNVTFVADDKDHNLHMNDAEILANRVTNEHPDFNVDKIYFDAFQQVSTTGGERYPDVNKRIIDQVQRGTLIMTYVGHGGEVGWAEERVLDIPTILNWTNMKNLTIFFTATCEFARFDDHNRTSAGEYCILNQNGGSVALFSTTRLVFASQNFILANDFFDYVFDDIKNPNYRLGDIIMLTKRASSGSSANHRNFSLLGDPALRLAYPTKDVKTTSINGIPAADVQIVVDTLNALSKVKFVGSVELNGQDPTGYTGTLYSTIYGKEKSLSTLGNKGATPFNYVIRNTIIFSGKSSINDGQFEFEFIVPKDIPFQYGVGKVSYYMVKDNSFDDGAGYAYNFDVGGANLDAPEDTKGPDIEIFLNDEDFVSGSIVNENPILLAKIQDDFGINTAGTGIGHDITAVIDGKNENTIVLNDFYESDEDTYQSGKLKYQLQELGDGKHTLELKAWDVYNNSSTSLIDFEVKQKSELSIDHLLNYPNPFTTYTEFWFEHNQALSTLQIQIQIYTVSGRLVKSIHETIQTDGYRSDPIAWDGRDDFGDRLARGVYIYKLKVQTTDGNSVEKFEKLVILN